MTTHGGVVVLAENVEGPAVEAGLDLVELGHVGVLDHVDEHFAADDDEKGGQDLARDEPGGQDGEAMGQDRGRVQRHRARAVLVAHVDAGAGDREAADLDEVAHADDEEHDPEVEALDDVGARQLEEILLVEALEDGALDLDKLVGEQEGEEGVGVGVDGHVEGDDLVVEHRRVQAVVDQGEEEEGQGRKEGAAGGCPGGQQLWAEEALKDILAEGREEPVANLEDVVDDVQLDG